MRWATIGHELGEPEHTLDFFAPMFEGPNREWAKELGGQAAPASPSQPAPQQRRSDHGLGKTTAGEHL